MYSTLLRLNPIKDAVEAAVDEGERGEADGEEQGTRGRYRARGMQVQKPASQAAVRNLTQPKVVPLDRHGEEAEGAAVSEPS